MDQIVFAFVVAYAVELLIGKLRGDDWKKIRDHFKSSTVIVLGLLIFLLSRHWWFYGAAALVAILSKTFLTRPSGQHAYNPTGFAILSMVAIFPHHVFIRGDQYNGYLFPYILVLVLGSISTFLVDRWRQTLCYIFGSLVASLIISASSPNFEILRLFGPDFGVEGLLFMLLMFTDPKTSPRSHKIQLFAGFIIGLINVTCRSLEFAYSQFLAIFLVSSFVTPWFDNIERNLKWPRFELPSSIRKHLSHAFGALVLTCLVLSWFLKIEAWPLTDYRMFAQEKKVSEVTALRFKANGKQMEVPRSYLGLHFFVESLLNANRIEDAKRMIRKIYRHQSNSIDGETVEFTVERLRIEPEGTINSTEVILTFKNRNTSTGGAGNAPIPN